MLPWQHSSAAFATFFLLQGPLFIFVVIFLLCICASTGFDILRLWLVGVVVTYQGASDMQITLSGVSRPHLSLLKGHDEVHNGNLENNIALRRFFKLSDYTRGSFILLFLVPLMEGG